VGFVLHSKRGIVFFDTPMVRSCIVASLLPLVSGQGAGTLKENHLIPVTISENGVENSQTTLTLDANWRWSHKNGESTNCYTGNLWDGCNGAEACAQACELEGVSKEDWKAPYGVTEVSGGVDLQFVTQGPYSKNVGSRMYVLEGEQYKMFKLLGKQFEFDVDVSNMPCGTNGAVYFVEMPADGGMGSEPLNKAGPKYGTGYCDAQCPQDLKWTKGGANFPWTPSEKDPWGNSGHGPVGACCTELDIWESNKMSSAYTMHSSSTAGSGAVYCKDSECGDPDGDRFAGPTDRNGCDINAFRFQVEDFYGPGSNFKLDTTKKFTIVTQFHESGGKLTGVSQHYVQDGKKIEHPNYLGLGNTETDDFCAQKAKAMGDRDSFAEKGGMAAVEASLKKGVVLVLSMWDDIDVHMNWLDSVMDGDDGSVLGKKRGTCDPKDGDPVTLREKYPTSHVSYTNFKVNDIDGPSPSPSPTPSPTPTPSDCPGGSLNACIDLCPADVFAQCVESCQRRCASVVV